MTLNNLKPGQKCKVLKLHGKGKLKYRIVDMGIIPGTEVLLKRMAPFGDPMQISLRGYELSIRKSDAKNIEITDIERKPDDAKRCCGA
ncbi:MAG: ferrous iron transport protein A [Clostridia bacterium]|nr:ferrous iron transport protein A [Clostridia bacterium]